MKLAPTQLLAGILEPAFAIRTGYDLGIGDTEGMPRMIDWVHRHHLNFLQILPINEISDDNSPYNALSSLAIEPTTIAVSPRHLPALSAAQFRKPPPPDLVAGLRGGPVNYAEVRPLKRKLLEAAFGNFLKRHFNRETERALQFRAFMMENAEWVPGYALFRLRLEENNHTPASYRWVTAHRTPGP